MSRPSKPHHADAHLKVLIPPQHADAAIPSWKAFVHARTTSWTTQGGDEVNSRVLEALIHQLKATLVIAEATLDGNQPGNRPTVYDVADVAEILGVSEETVRRRVRSGELGAVTSGSRWLSSQAAQDRYLSADMKPSSVATHSDRRSSAR